MEQTSLMTRALSDQFYLLFIIITNKKRPNERDILNKKWADGTSGLVSGISSIFKQKENTG